jgi:hypothetical protein
MNTIGQAISRVRNTLKTVKEDPFMTDRFIHSLVMKYAKTLIKRDARMDNIFKHVSLFTELTCIELIDVDKIDACCLSIQTGCTFKRSKDKLPEIVVIGGGNVIRTVATLDFSKVATETLPSIYSNMTKMTTFKYNKSEYFWFIDGYLYIPNVEWEGVRMEAMFEGDVQNACEDEPSECKNKQDETLSIPEDLFSEIEQMVRQEILTAGQIPSDGADDGQNVMR